MENETIERIVLKQRAKNVGEKVLAFLFDPEPVARVHSSMGAVEADVDDRGLMQHYVDHPESERKDSIADYEVTSKA